MPRNKKNDIVRHQLENRIDIARSRCIMPFGDCSTNRLMVLRHGEAFVLNAGSYLIFR